MNKDIDKAMMIMIRYYSEKQEEAINNLKEVLKKQGKSISEHVILSTQQSEYYHGKKEGLEFVLAYANGINYGVGYYIQWLHDHDIKFYPEYKGFIENTLKIDDASDYVKIS